MRGATRGVVHLVDYVEGVLAIYENHFLQRQSQIIRNRFAFDRAEN